MWSLLQDHIMCDAEYDCQFIERNDVKNNIYRKDRKLSTDKIINERAILPLTLSRYLGPKIDLEVDNQYVFHSSYYRNINDCKSKKIVTVHDFIYERYMSGMRRKLHQLQKYCAINQADIVVCVSKNTCEDLFRYLPDVDKDKVEVIYNGVSTDFYQDLSIEKDDRLLYVGSRAKYKNFDKFIEALSETSYGLDICGAPLTKNETYLLNKKIGKNRYRVYSNIDNKGLNQLYNKALCLVYPSSYEGFGLPIIEAQKAGCPVIALCESAMQEIIGPSPLLMPKMDCKTMRKHIKMLQSQDLINEVVEMGIANSQRFSGEKMADLYKEIYRRL